MKVGRSKKQVVLVAATFLAFGAGTLAMADAVPMMPLAIACGRLGTEVDGQATGGDTGSEDQVHGMQMAAAGMQGLHQENGPSAPAGSSRNSFTPSGARHAGGDRSVARPNMSVAHCPPASNPGVGEQQ
jgi:hypothetical protein